MDGGSLGPHQEAILDDLLLVGHDPPPADRSIAGRLRQELASGLAAGAGGPATGHRVWVSKHRLRYVFECEGQLRARDAEGWTGWNVASARGRVTHRAMEALILSGYRSPPLAAARDAFEHLASGDDDLAAFLSGLGEGHRHDLVRDANNALVRFIGDWPPIPEAWWPTVEARSRVAFGPVTFDAVVDMALRIPFASGSRTFLVDFKTGLPDDAHRDDVRFYALAETLRTRVPPYRVATYYLDTGDWSCEDVGESLLSETAARVLDGVGRMIRIEAGGEPALEPGTYCRYCGALATCAPGQEWMAILGGSRPRRPA